MTALFWKEAPLNVTIVCVSICTNRIWKGFRNPMMTKLLVYFYDQQILLMILAKRDEQVSWKMFDTNIGINVASIFFHANVVVITNFAILTQFVIRCTSTSAFPFYAFIAFFIAFT